jgi:hypothetical protein
VQVERASSSFALGSSSSFLREGEEKEDFEELFGRNTPAQQAAERASKGAARAAGVAADSAAAVARAVRSGLEEEEEEEFEEGSGDGERRKALPADTRRRAPTKEDLADRRYDRDLLRSFDERLRERELERKEEEGKEKEGEKR